MEYKFSISCKAFSINQAYYATRKVKTRACRDWEEGVAHALKQCGLPNLSKYKFPCEVALEFVYPVSIFYNKEGRISAKTMDLSNVEKLFIDVLFGQVLQYNDKNIVKLTSSKRAGFSWAINGTLELKAQCKSYNPISSTSGTNE
jgi:hypothetical protein